MAIPFRTWGEAFERVCLELPNKLADEAWQPTQTDQKAAWELLTEIRTRITTESLHFRSGDEETALDSVYKLFGISRDTIKEYGPESRLVAELMTRLLNEKVRPFTARWHKAKIAGKLAIEDVRHDFRTDLQNIQPCLIQAMHLLGYMALGDSYVEEEPLARTGRGARMPPPDGERTFLYKEDVELHGESGTPGDVIRSAEYKEIHRRRGNSNCNEPLSGVVGLAFSGGGIRSSTFSLGVVQSLAKHGLMQDVDYLSTVSGGGYIGSFLSSYLNGPDIPDGSRSRPSWEELAGDSRPIRYLRDNARYLESESLGDKVKMVAFVLYGTFANALVIVPVLTALLALTYLPPLFGLVKAVLIGTGSVVTVGIWSFLGVFAAFVLLAYTVTQKLKWSGGSSAASIASVVALGFIGIALALELTAVIARPLAGGKLTWSSIALGLPFVTAVLVALRAGILSFLAKGKGLVLRLLLLVTGLASIVFPLAVYLYLANQYVIGTVQKGSYGTNLYWFIAIALVSFLFVFFFLDVNWTSPHVLYRNRLCQTFLIRPDSGPKGVVQRPELKLSSLCREGEQRQSLIAPYHLINAAVNVPKSKEKSLQGRGADFFLFSKHYCGSSATGYCPTEKLEKADKRLELGTAMAISGAAASSLMGMLSVKPVSWALTLLNVRLGYWLQNPSKLNASAWWFGAGPWYLFKKYRGNADETSGRVNVSDGGHLENLAIYELLRRQCRIIIAVDGEADGDLTCKSLMQLMRFADVDMDVKLNIDLDDIRTIENGLSRAHFNLGTIEYPPMAGSVSPNQGFLVYIKASLTGDEPLPVLDYRSRHADFPHQSTADQFFDEAQFEAYRQLGYHIAGELFRQELLEGSYRNPDDWLEALANKLLPDDWEDCQGG